MVETIVDNENDVKGSDFGGDTIELFCIDKYGSQSFLGNRHRRNEYYWTLFLFILKAEMREKWLDHTRPGQPERAERKVIW